VTFGRGHFCGLFKGLPFNRAMHEWVTLGYFFGFADRRSRRQEKGRDNSSMVDPQGDKDFQPLSRLFRLLF
jgi:hypothetical protein